MVDNTFKGGGEPAFNSAIAYLERIDQLFRSMHIGLTSARSSRMGMQNLVVTLDLISVEILPRIHTKEERDELENMINNARNSPVYPNVLTAFKFASLMAHRYKLIMPDKDSIYDMISKA